MFGRRQTQIYFRRSKRKNRPHSKICQNSSTHKAIFPTYTTHIQSLKLLNPSVYVENMSLLALNRSGFATSNVKIRKSYVFNITTNYNIVNEFSNNHQSREIKFQKKHGFKALTKVTRNR